MSRYSLSALLDAAAKWEPKVLAKEVLSRADHDHRHALRLIRYLRGAADDPFTRMHLDLAATHLLGGLHNA